MRLTTGFILISTATRGPLFTGSVALTWLSGGVVHGASEQSRHKVRGGIESFGCRSLGALRRARECLRASCEERSRHPTSSRYGSVVVVLTVEIGNGREDDVIACLIDRFVVVSPREISGRRRCFLFERRAGPRCLGWCAMTGAPGCASCWLHCSSTGLLLLYARRWLRMRSSDPFFFPSSTLSPSPSHLYLPTSLSAPSECVCNPRISFALAVGYRRGIDGFWIL